MIFRKAKFTRIVGSVCAASVASSLCLPVTSKAASPMAFLPSIYQLLLNSKSKAKAKADAPNFITIVVDDMGYSDFGYLGGEIPTPNIDALADQGIKLTSFYAAPASTPSRAMLFTGIDNHMVGIGRMRRFHNEQEEEPGYEDYLNRDYKPFFQVLNEGGYYTMMTGKWDVGGNAPLSTNPLDYDPDYDPNNPNYPKLFAAIQAELTPLYPINRGFDATRALLLPGGDVHFSHPIYDGVNGDPTAYTPPTDDEPAGTSIVNTAGIMVPSTQLNPSLPLPLTVVPLYTENGKSQVIEEGPDGESIKKLDIVNIREVTGTEEDGTPKYGTRPVPKFPKDFYSTDYYTDMAIDMLDDPNRDKSKPFYLNVSHIAPHTPLQAPEALRDKYQPTYAQGWDVMIAERFRKMKSLGLIPEDAEVPDRPADIPAWADLSTAQREVEARRMAVYAGMIEKIDDNVGKLVDHLKKLEAEGEEGAYTNTVILVMSDNGAERACAAFNGAARRRYINNNLDQSYENMGNWNSYLGMSKGWARVQNAPYNMYKGSTFDGGVRTAAFIHYPQSPAYASQEEEKYDGITSIMDIAPTLLAMAGLEFDSPDPVTPIPTNPQDPYIMPAYDSRTPAQIAQNPPQIADPQADVRITAPRTEKQYGCSMAGLINSGSLTNACSKNRMIGWEVDGAKGFRWDVANDIVTLIDPGNSEEVEVIVPQGKWKLSMIWGEGERYYFYDLSNDPFERNELDSDYGDVYPPERNKMKGWIWDAYLEYARVNNVISVGNPIISDKDPTDFIDFITTGSITGTPASITYEGFLEMSREEQEKVITPTEQLAAPYDMDMSEMDE